MTQTATICPCDDTNGAHLGPVGSLLESEVFGGMLQLDKNGMRRTDWATDSTFTLGNFLQAAGSSHDFTLWLAMDQPLLLTSDLAGAV